MTDDEIRTILTAEAELRIDLKVAKAEAFLQLVDNRVKVAEAWQRVAIEVEELERRYEHANVERLMVWITTGSRPPIQEAEL